MRWREYCPHAVRDYLGLLRVRWRYPGRSIATHQIAENVQLGVGVGVSRNVVIGAGVRIGRFSYINSDTKVVSGEIGAFCSIGPGCIIGPNEHPTKFVSTSPWLYGPGNILGVEPCWNEFQHETVIGSDVWVGCGSVVLQGARVGTGAIVAAGAVVRGEVDPYSIVGGVPARRIGWRFSPEVIGRLVSLGWWEWPVERLRREAGLFASGASWIKRVEAE